MSHSLRRFSANSVTRGGCVLTAPLHALSASNLLLMSRPTPSLLPARRVAAIISQSRLFHQTQTRRSLLWPLNAVNIGIYSFIIFFAARYVQIKSGWSTLPPHTWARIADQKTREGVESTLSMAFKMARNAPMRQRNIKLREVSFLVPHEVARLNKKSPHFHLEDMGPVSSGSIPLAWIGDALGPPLDLKTESCAFLYFPKGSSKAAAVFLAVNYELHYLAKMMKQPPNDEARLNKHSESSVIRVIDAFVDTHGDWERSCPKLADRMRGVGQLPVICNFRESVFGFPYYPGIKFSGFPAMAAVPLDVTDFDHKTWKTPK